MFNLSIIYFTYLRSIQALHANETNNFCGCLLVTWGGTTRILIRSGSHSISTCFPMYLFEVDEDVFLVKDAWSRISRPLNCRHLLPLSQPGVGCGCGFRSNSPHPSTIHRSPTSLLLSSNSPWGTCIYSTTPNHSPPEEVLKITPERKGDIFRDCILSAVGIEDGGPSLEKKGEERKKENTSHYYLSRMGETGHDMRKWNGG